MTGIKDPLNIADDDRRHPVLGKHKALELAEHPGTSYAAAAELRAQHALIVQMREELADLKSRMEQLTAALAAADQYLGEQA